MTFGTPRIPSRQICQSARTANSSQSSSPRLSIDLPVSSPSKCVGRGGTRRSSRALGNRSEAGLFHPRKSSSARLRVSDISRARAASGASGRTCRSAFVSAECQANSSAEPTIKGYSTIADCKSSSVLKHGTDWRPARRGFLQQSPAGRRSEPARASDICNRGPQLEPKRSRGLRLRFRLPPCPAAHRTRTGSGDAGSSRVAPSMIAPRTRSPKVASYHPSKGADHALFQEVYIPIAVSPRCAARSPATSPRPLSLGGM